MIGVSLVLLSASLVCSIASVFAASRARTSWLDPVLAFLAIFLAMCSAIALTVNL